MQDTVAVSDPVRVCYRFGGATLVSLLHNCYKALKSSKTRDKDIVANEIHIGETFSLVQLSHITCISRSFGTIRAIPLLTWWHSCSYIFLIDFQPKWFPFKVKFLVPPSREE